MSKSSAVLMYVAAVLFAAVYVFPLWEIDLKAPQYPQGLGLHIWVDKITGRAPYDLQNINGLNHYIGMKAIEPDAIPELKYMKYIAGLLIALAAAAALSRKRWVLAVFVIVALVLSAAGLYDFWKWEYEYGHELDPDAAIKVPGMSYQPPLFGSKQLLNFRTTAWPHLGGVAAILAVAIGVVVLLVELTRNRFRSRKAGVEIHRSLPAVAVPLVLLTAVIALAPGCGQKAQPIEYGSDECAFCRMTITDSRYGTEIVTRKSRVYKYDSIECMVRAITSERDFPAADAARSYVTDFDRPGELIDAETASYLRSEELPSPMGMNLTAFARRDAAERQQAERGGDVFDWAGLREYVTGTQGGHPMEHGGH